MMLQPGHPVTVRLALLPLLLALAVASCETPPEPLPFEPASAEAAPDPAEFGPFPVGVRTVEILDYSRPHEDGTPRKLVTEVWYPAVEAARGVAGRTYDIRSVLTDQQREDVKELPMPALQTIAVSDAAPRKDRGPFPLVVFSHGQSAIRWQSTFFTVLLASHGYIVASPDHEGATLYEAVRDVPRLDLTALEEGFTERPRDVIQVIDWFLGLVPEGSLPVDDPLHGLVDGDKIGLSGHSFGGFTSFRVAALDERIKAIVPMAPTSVDLSWIDQAKEFRLKIPVMIEAARLDKTLPWDEHIEPSWPRLDRPRYLLELKRGGHFTFSDLCQFDLAAVVDKIGFADLSNVIDDGCGPESIPSLKAFDLVNHFGVGFFNRYLRGSTASGALLDLAHAEELAAGEADVRAEAAVQ